MTAQHIMFGSQEVLLAGTLMVPEHNATDAAVLCVTGGGDKASDHYYLEWQKHLAQQLGIASLAFSARGIGGSRGFFRTDSEGYEEGAPVNSQASRTADALQAFRFLHYEINGVDMSRIGIIGGSMGGDIALHAIEQIPAAALLLRAPAAYPEGIDSVEYGPEWGRQIKALGGEDASLRSPNFKLIQKLALPLLLVYSRGENIIPEPIQHRYIKAVQRARGDVLQVGDRKTGHNYLNASTDPSGKCLVDSVAKQYTFWASTEFFARNLLS